MQLNNFYKGTIKSILFIVLLVGLRLLQNHLDLAYRLDFMYMTEVFTVLFIIGVSWFILSFLRIVKDSYLSHFDLSNEENLHARKVHTQTNVLMKVVTVIIVLVALGLSLLAFDNLKEIGLSLFASAGVAGIILGFAAQKMLAALFAGIQIAFTQPIRIEDAVIVEGEYGWIEEINLTFVVVRLWDKRRLVVPSTYFVENVFQNWTRNSSDLLGPIVLHLDYSVPVDAIRSHLDKILETTELWNGEVKAVQVIDSSEFTIQVRILVSGKDSSTTWNLRVLIREQMIKYLQKEYPDSLPKRKIKQV